MWLLTTNRAILHWIHPLTDRSGKDAAYLNNRYYNKQVHNINNKLMIHTLLEYDIRQ